MIYVILAFVIGYYLGNSSQRREDRARAKELISKATPHKKEHYKIIKMNKPKTTYEKLKEKEQSTG